MPRPRYIPQRNRRPRSEGGVQPGGHFLLTKLPRRIHGVELPLGDYEREPNEREWSQRNSELTAKHG